MTLDDDIRRSREYEMETYLNSMESMYKNAVLQNGENFDNGFLLTKGFTEITGEALLTDSRIIGILRYCIAPTISQMKLGQILDLKTTKDFEENRLTPTTNAYRKLVQVANKAASFINERIDKTRFVWLDDITLDSALVRDFAKKWTCSLAADQNAQTRYRNWRKQLQEQKLIRFVIQRGYVASGYTAPIERAGDIRIGEFRPETKVKGRTIQKADLVLRCRQTKKLVLIEAKAVGVELDATKRIKECADKSRDWRSSAALENPDIIAVIAGFFSETQLENLKSAGVRFVWEHRIEDLFDATAR